MTKPTEIPKRGIAKAARAKLDQVRRMSGGCATCGKIRGALLRAARLVVPGR